MVEEEGGDVAVVDWHFGAVVCGEDAELLPLEEGAEVEAGEVEDVFVVEEDGQVGQDQLHCLFVPLLFFIRRKHIIIIRAMRGKIVI